MFRGGVLYNRKVKAFTLIELLAVIVILAIIALIAIPVILGVINDSKYKAFKLSLDNVFHSYELYAAGHEIEPGTEVDIRDLPLDSKNLTGKAFENENGDIEIKEVTDGTYSAEGTKDDLSIVEGTIDDLRNKLDLKLHAIPSTTKIDVTVETILGAPKNYNYKIEKEDYTKEINNQKGNKVTFNKLFLDTEYKITVSVRNNYGVETILTKLVKTLKTEPIKLDLNPKDEYIKTGKVTLTYPKINNVTYEYKWLEDADWMESKDLTFDVTAKNSTLLTRIREEENILLTNEMTISNIDIIDPVINFATIQKTTNSITIPYSIVEEHIKDVTCKYSDTNGSYTIDAPASESACSLTNLDNSKTYYYQVCVTDKAGNKVCKTGDTKPEAIVNPSISVTHTPANASASTTGGYSQEELVKVTFSNKNITTPTYYIKSTFAGTTSANVLASCTEENSKPKTCTNASTNAIKANTWYKVSGNINVTYNTETNANQTLYAVTFDGTNYSNSSTGTTLKIDRTKPTLSIKAVKATANTAVNSNTWSNQKLKITLTKGTVGNSGSSLKYCVDTANTCTPNLAATSGTAISLNNTGTYYIRYKAVGGSGVESNLGTYTAKVATISGTPKLTASWPNTTQIKVVVSGMTVAGDTLQYRYLLGSTVKQDWTTTSNYTYTGLTAGQANTIKVETRLKTSTFGGNSKTATIYTSKNVSATNSGYSSNSACTSSTYNYGASGVYGAVTLKSPSCTSYSEKTGTEAVYSSCSTSYSTSGSCASSRSCTVSGHSGSVSFSSSSTGSTSYSSWSLSSSDTVSKCSPINSSSCSSCTSYTTCSSPSYTKTTKTRTCSKTYYGYCWATNHCFETVGSCQSDCGNKNCSGVTNSSSCLSSHCSGCSSLKTSDLSCSSWSYSTSYNQSYCSEQSAPSMAEGTQSYVSSCSASYTKKTYTRTATTSRTCYYSGNVQTGTKDVYSTKYKATYSGVVKPTTTVY